MAEIFLCFHYINGIMQGLNRNIAYTSKLLVFREGGGGIWKRMNKENFEVSFVILQWKSMIA
jgi:hypothetical protein